MLALVLPPHSSENTQHTPKDEAQLPLAVPPNTEHSDAAVNSFLPSASSKLLKAHIASLLTCVAGSIEAASRPGGSADSVGEGDDVEDGEKSVRSWLGLQ